MAKETTSTDMKHIVIDKPKLVVGLLGNPKKVVAMDKEGARYLVGTIFGVAQGVKAKTLPDRKGDPQVYEMIVGDFEGIPSEPVETDYDGEKVIVDAFRSGVLYLPSGIHDRLAAALKGDDAQPVKFAIEIYTVKASNPAGYSYEARALTETQVSDPLAEMRAQLQGKVKALPKPAKAA